MDFLNASTAQMTAYFMKRWGMDGDHTQISEHDLSSFDISASARGTPKWQRAIIEIALNAPDKSGVQRLCLLNAIKIAIETGVKVPVSVQEANPASTDTTFKNLENQYHKIRKHIEFFPDIDPYKPHNLEMMCDAIIVGRFDVAAQIFASAEKKTKRDWIRRLRLK
ncbi:hypothetical protein SD208_08755 [Ochrobactrum sp. BD67]